MCDLPVVNSQSVHFTCSTADSDSRSQVSRLSGSRTWLVDCLIVELPFINCLLVELPLVDCQKYDCQKYDCQKYDYLKFR